MAKSRPTFTFLGLIALAAGASYAALLLTTQFSNNQPEEKFLPPTHKVASNQNINPVPTTEIDTTDWKSYVDKEYFLSFKYPPSWQIETYNGRQGYYIIVLKPDKAADHIRIYVSPNNYFALAGLPTKPTNLAGAKAITVHDMIVGVKFAAQYYTFDLGTDTKLQPQFRKILATVAFSK